MAATAGLAQIGGSAKYECQPSGTGMTETIAQTPGARSPGRQAGAGDVKLIGLVSAAHSLSHFYQLVLPPIFPLLTDVFGVGYAELGLVASLMYIASGLMQTPAGILVDRLGPSRVLIGGVGLFSASVLLSGLVPGFWWLAPLAILAGLGNAVFHPADYAIMTARVDPRRLGRAFGAHGVAGNLGWVAAPASVLGLTALFGWRAALVILGGIGLALTLYLVSTRALLSGETGTGPVERAARTEAGAGAGLRVLLGPSVLLCFAYFTLLSVAQVGLQTFFPSAAVAAFGVSIGAANAMLTGFLVAAALGMLAGGVVADRFRRHELVVGIGLAVAAALSLVFAVAALPMAVLASCAGIAGFAMGATMPARDMIVRGAAPPGGTGKVFGFVYSGLDLGGAITPPLLGLLLDHGMPRMVFATSALAFAVAIGSAVVVGREPKSRRARPVATAARR
jgi:FSR family fosmidomycin resistance protein-like MFS transporter